MLLNGYRDRLSNNRRIVRSMKFVSQYQLQRVFSGFKYKGCLGLTKAKMLNLTEHRLMKWWQCFCINQHVVVPRIIDGGAGRGNTHPF